MPIVRSYADADWQAVLESCLLAFTTVYESFERLLGTELVLLVYPDWKASNEKYLRSLTEPGESERIFVVEDNGAVVGFIHYSVGGENQSGKVGLNAVDPAHRQRPWGADVSPCARHHARQGNEVRQG